MNRWRQYAWVGLAAVCAGCASAPAGGPAKKAPVERASEERPYDFRSEGQIPPLAPDAPNEPDVEEIGVADSAIEVTDAEAPPDTVRRQAPSAALVDGFRVQVLASADRDVAENAARAAEEKLGLHAYVDLDGGVYKVRVGDFVARADAEKALAGVRRHYADAWIVASQVRGAADDAGGAAPRG